MRKELLLLTVFCAAGCNPFMHRTPESDEREIVKLEYSWNKAIRARDSVALDRLLAPDFTLGADGRSHRSVPRAIWISATLRPVAFDTLGSDNIAVAIRGDTARAELRTFWRARVAGTSMSAASRVADVWVRHGDRWRVRSRRVIREDRPPRMASR
jgi:ketosteroid isomerase-like protein